ncbi:MAG: tRNA pseudouridine(55) synthase TruB [Chlamydiales bacterium]
MRLKEGILPVNKPQGCTSFSLIRTLRKLTGIKKIGHTGTLDPFATGVLVILIGREYTRLCDKFLLQDKEYVAKVHLGVSTDTFDCDGKVMALSKKIPTPGEIDSVLAKFQGEIEQIPPMFSAKKVQGKKLYKLAREGKSIERKPVKIRIQSDKLHYSYPHLSLRIACSKGTYIRSFASEIGDFLGCGAYLLELQRTRNGPFHLDECIDGKLLNQPDFDISPYLKIHESYPQH